MLEVQKLNQLSFDKYAIRLSETERGLTCRVAFQTCLEIQVNKFMKIRLYFGKYSEIVTILHQNLSNLANTVMHAAVSQI